jgi:hypothetical protein
MTMPNLLRFASGFLVIVSLAGMASGQAPAPAPLPPVPGRVDPPLLEGPATDLEPITRDQANREGAATSDVEGSAPSHDALRTAEAPRPVDRARALKQPPAPIVERPSGARPQRRAEWVPGYWDWDPARAEFGWTGGVWQVPPPGTIWVSSRWMRDGDGWYRRPGFWSRRRGSLAVATNNSQARSPAWRMTGPPADHPADKGAEAPGADYFFIPGYYAPDGDQLRWKPGFWSAAQVGWDWIPARWVRRPSGWEFRAGRWAREPDAVDVRVTVGGRPGARVVAPGIVQDRDNPDTAIDQPPPPPDSEDESDPIARAEAAGRVRVVVPGTGMPYYVIRPPGSYPYGPGGVVVPGAVPPFVRRILDQVLP